MSRHRQLSRLPGHRAQDSILIWVPVQAQAQLLAVTMLWMLTTKWLTTINNDKVKDNLLTAGVTRREQILTCNFSGR